MSAAAAVSFDMPPGNTITEAMAADAAAAAELTGWVGSGSWWPKSGLPLPWMGTGCDRGAWNGAAGRPEA